MIKSQDCLILLKLLSNPNQEWSQRSLAKSLIISLAEINGGIKRLTEARLLRKDTNGKLIPIISAAEEFLIYAVKYQFPGKLGTYTKGIPTAYAAPLFRRIIVLGDDPIPVWPYAFGETKGVALIPIHASIPKALMENPDNELYELIALIDTIRIGKARERNIAIKLLKEKLTYDQQ